MPIKPTELLALILFSILTACAMYTSEECFTDTCVGCTDDCLEPMNR